LFGNGTNAAAGTMQNSGSPLVSGGTGAAGAAAAGPATPLRPGGTGIAAAATAAAPAGRAAAFSGTGGSGGDADATALAAGSGVTGGPLFGPGALGAAGATGGNTSGGQEAGNAAVGLPVAHEGWIYGDGYGGTGASLVGDDIAAHGGSFAPLDGSVPPGFTAPAGHVVDGNYGVGGQMLGQRAANPSA
jgi:hypothetical protein